MTAWLFEGKLSFIEEIDQAPWLPAPKLVICPQPWGASFSQPVSVQETYLVEVPGGQKETQVEWMEHDCEKISDRIKRCSCLDFSENELAPHGKRGQMEYIDYIKLSFSAKNDDVNTQQFAFGFYTEQMPQQWSYGTLGHAVEGDIRYEEVAEGKTEFTEGTAVDRYAFRVSGDGPTQDGHTSLIFGYDKFLVYVMASFTSKFSVFAIVTVFVTFCAAINNFGLFEIAFPEKAETSALEPSCFLRVLCSCCISCVEQRAPPPLEDDVEKATQGGDGPAQVIMSPRRSIRTQYMSPRRSIRTGTGSPYPQVGTKVEVWSEGEQSWILGTVTRREENLRFITVTYDKKTGGVTEKNIPFEEIYELTKVGMEVEVWSEGKNSWIPAAITRRDEKSRIITVKHDSSITSGGTEKDIPFENVHEFIRDRLAVSLAG